MRQAHARLAIQCKRSSSSPSAAYISSFHVNFKMCVDKFKTYLMIQISFFKANFFFVFFFYYYLVLQFNCHFEGIFFQFSSGKRNEDPYNIIRRQIKYITGNKIVPRYIWQSLNGGQPTTTKMKRYHSIDSNI